MVEQQWMIARAGDKRLALSLEETWAVLDSPAVRPLPGARPWCAGWVAFQDHVVPVLGGGGYSRLGRPEVLLVVERQGALLGIPCQHATLCKGFLSDNSGEEGEAGLPFAGAVEAPGTEAAWRMDLERLYSVLGIQ